MLGQRMLLHRRSLLLFTRILSRQLALYTMFKQAHQRAVPPMGRGAANSNRTAEPRVGPKAEPCIVENAQPHYRPPSWRVGLDCAGIALRREARRVPGQDVLEVCTLQHGRQQTHAHVITVGGRAKPATSDTQQQHRV